METVQLQCGHCQQVIAIGVEHLGGQVRCPHCQGVLQTPARETPSPIPNMELTPRESPVAAADSADTASSVELLKPASAESSVETTRASEPESAFPRVKPRPIFDRGVVLMYVLIFLVPYAVLTTLALLYFLVQATTPRIHPFDILKDPDAKGGPKKVSGKFDPLGPLADHQKVALGKSITVGKDGDLEVTPEKVQLADDDVLRLFLRAKNISRNTAFTPISDSYLRYDPEKPESTPYTFLESSSGSPANIYGAFLAFRKNTTDEDAGRDSLKPGEETVILLSTNSNKKGVAVIAKGNDTYTWRVQLRRGFVRYQNKDVPATAVIGVEFTSSQIERDKKG
jgi:hypothetical protein